MTDRQTSRQTELPWHIRAIAYAVARKNGGVTIQWAGHSGHHGEYDRSFKRVRQVSAQSAAETSDVSLVPNDVHILNV